MSEVNWANAVSMVATVDGLLVTERGADGTVGAAYSSKLLRSMMQQSARRAPSYATPPDLTPDGVSQVRQRLPAFMMKHPGYLIIDELTGQPSLGYTNKYKGVWGWTDSDEIRANSFIAWWNQNMAGTPVQGGQQKTYGALASCGFGPTGCSVLNPALANALIYWETQYIGDKGLGGVGAAAPWDRPLVRDAVLMVATVDGLLVTERGADGTVGAAPKVLRAMPTAERLVPGLHREAVLDYGTTQTYRIVKCSWVEPAKSPSIDKRFLIVDEGIAKKGVCQTITTFKALDDATALQALLIGGAYPFEEMSCFPLGGCSKSCHRIDRLDAKPGYVSVWTQIGGGCPPPSYAPLGF